MPFDCIQIVPFVSRNTPQANSTNTPHHHSEYVTGTWSLTGERFPTMRLIPHTPHESLHAVKEMPAWHKSKDWMRTYLSLGHGGFVLSGSLYPLLNTDALSLLTKNGWHPEYVSVSISFSLSYCIYFMAGCTTSLNAFEGNSPCMFRSGEVLYAACRRLNLTQCCPLFFIHRDSPLPRPKRYILATSRWSKQIEARSGCTTFAWTEGCWLIF